MELSWNYDGTVRAHLIQKRSMKRDSRCPFIALVIPRAAMLEAKVPLD